MIIIYITCKDKEEAVKISKVLLDKKVIACTNLFPIQSIYWWKGKLEEDNEYAVIAKTKDENYEKVRDLVRRIHSYETPCVISWKINKINKEFHEWILTSLEN